MSNLRIMKNKMKKTILKSHSLNIINEEMLTKSNICEI